MRSVQAILSAHLGNFRCQRRASRTVFYLLVAIERGKLDQLEVFALFPRFEYADPSLHNTVGKGSDEPTPVV